MMLILTGRSDVTQLMILKDGSEIEITPFELEGAKSIVLIRASKEVEVIHELLDRPEA
ncbi:MAG: sRNA-binding carbon storage regulator CsrA [Candidatus Azotimanducaceae bacterium]|jgi:sRNA-binding carbon storage regulator CsrA